MLSTPSRYSAISHGSPAASAGLAMTLMGSMAGAAASLTDYPVYGGQAFRYALAAAALGLVFRLTSATPVNPQPRLRPRDLRQIFVLSLVGMALFNVLLLATVDHASPAMLGSVLAMLPLVLAVLAPLMNGSRPSPRLVIAAGLVAGGAALAAGLGSTTLIGLVLALLTLSCEVGFSLLAIPLIHRFGALRTSTYASAGTVPQLIIVGLIAHGADFVRVPTLPEAIALLYIALPVSVIGFLAWYSALPKLGADRAGLFAGMVPIGAMLSGIVAGIGWPSYAELGGSTLVIAGIAYAFADRASRRRPDRQRQPAATATKSCQVVDLR